jgi:Methyltransferase domain
MRRASATLTSMGFTEFVLHHLPPAPARVLEVGCGDRGGVVPALVDAGYDALGVDPRAPAGTRYRQADFREVEGEFDAVVAGRVIHHLVPLDAAVERMAGLAPLVLVDEFAWDLIDPELQAWYEAERVGRPDAIGPPSLDEWRWKHPGLHRHDAVLAALRARYDERELEWVPYFHHWLGDGVESPDRIGYVWAGVRTSTTRSSASSR